MSLLLVMAATVAQEIQVFDDLSDPHVAVLAALPPAAVTQTGRREAKAFAYTVTVRERVTGHLEHYLKVEIEYVTARGSSAVGASRALYANGQPADFLVIERTHECLPTAIMCKHHEL